jgi:Protein of unknown function (DUF3352)
MPRMSASRTVLASLVLVLSLAACGGDGDGGSATSTGTDSAASVVPASATGFVSINTDRESDQWKQLEELAGKFPGKDRLVDMISDELADEDVDLERDIEPAVGPEVALVFLGSADEAVILTQPDDQAALDALLAKGDEPSVKEEIGKWTAIAETQAELDAFKTAAEGAKLADDDAFQEAVGELPDEALVKAYGAGEGLMKALESSAGTSAGLMEGQGELTSVAAALEALDNGLKLAGSAQTDGLMGHEAYEPELLERIPSGALAVISFADLDENVSQLGSQQAARQFLPQIEQTLGITLDELAALVAGESALYVRQGSPIPEITLLAEPADEQQAVATLDKLAQRASALGGDADVGTTEVDGVQAKFVQVQGVRILYAAFDGMLVVTSGQRAIQEIRSDDDKLADDEAFSSAKEAAGMEDSTSGFMYVNLRDAIPLLQGFAGLAGEEVPPDVSSNLDPLDSLLVDSAKEGDELRFSAFLGLR